MKTRRSDPPKREPPQESSSLIRGSSATSAAASLRSSSFWPAVLALVALTVVAFLPILHNGFIWDDDQYISLNATLRTLDGLRRIWFEPGATPQYYPLTFTTFWIQYQVFGGQPFGFHLVNMALQAANAALLFVLLRRLRLPGAWLAAAIFAVHPIQVESVAWATERKNLLAGFFFLASFLGYLRFEDSDCDEATDPRRLYLASLGLFVAALLSKSVACCLPAVLLLVLWWQRGALDRRALLRLLPMFAVGAAMAAMTVWMEKNVVGAQGKDFALTFVDRCLIAGRALWFYASTLLWPRNLIFIYPRWIIDAQVWWQYVFPLAALAVLATLFVGRTKFGRGPLVATLCYAGSLAPALGFIDVYPMRYSFVADHFSYFSVAALIVLFSEGGVRLFERGGDAGHKLGMGLAAVMLVVLVLLTRQQSEAYRDLRSLWTDTLAKNPDCWMAHNNLGSVLKDEDGNADAAIMHYVSSLRLNPNNPEALNNMGIALASKGELDAAIQEYENALRLWPDFAAAHQDLGIALQAKGELPEAITHFSEAIRIQPDYAEAHYDLGLVFGGHGDVDRAIAHFSEAVRARPDFADAHYNLGVALGMKGRTDDAISHYRETLDLRPDYAQAALNLGVSLATEGRVDEALEKMRRALELKPDYAEAHDNLGLVLQHQGLIDEAIVHFQEALRLNDQLTQARDHLQAAEAARDSLKASSPNTGT